MNGINGYGGFIQTFLNQNPKNNISVVEFGGVPIRDGYKDINGDKKLLLGWTNSAKNVRIEEPPQAGTNYDAGLMAAEEQFNKKKDSKNSKLMLFISDGVPTYFIKDGKRYGRGTTMPFWEHGRYIDNVPYVRDQMLNYNVPDFYIKNPDIRTIAVGVSKDINSDTSSSSPVVLKEMARLSGGTFLGIKEDIGELTKKLTNEVLYAVSQVKITDTLSPFVKLDKAPDFKVTVTDKSGQTKTLWKGGKQTPENKNGEFIQSLTTTKDHEGEKVILTFNPNYKLDKNLKFTLSYNVTVPKETFEEYQKDGYLHTGDSNTDYPGNITSSGKKGFHSNKEAYVDFAFGPEEKKYTEFYDHPVVQVALQNLTIKKVDLEKKVSFRC